MVKKYLDAIDMELNLINQRTGLVKTLTEATRVYVRSIYEYRRQKNSITKETTISVLLPVAQALPGAHQDAI